jgi:hypothetical protein
MSNEGVLQLLHDVEGVVGTFIADSHGELLAQLCPPEIAEPALRRTALRVARIMRCADLCELDVRRCDLRFDRYQLLVWRFAGGVLGVLARAPVRKRALGMAARLVVREIQPVLLGNAAEPEDEVTSQFPSTRRSRDNVS